MRNCFQIDLKIRYQRYSFAGSRISRPFCRPMRKGRKKDLRKFDVYEIVIRMFATIVCAVVAVIVYNGVICSSVMLFFRSGGK